MNGSIFRYVFTDWYSFYSAFIGGLSQWVNRRTFSSENFCCFFFLKNVNLRQLLEQMNTHDERFWESKKYAKRICPHVCLFQRTVAFVLNLWATFIVRHISLNWPIKTFSDLKKRLKREWHCVEIDFLFIKLVCRSTIPRGLY